MRRSGSDVPHGSHRWVAVTTKASELAMAARTVRARRFTARSATFRNSATGYTAASPLRVFVQVRQVGAVVVPLPVAELLAGGLRQRLVLLPDRFQLLG